MQNTHYHILIVEDEENIREMIRMFLEREGYHVLECDTAEKANHILRTQTVHLVLLDWMLPKMDGIDFVKQLRHDPKLRKTPIIMLTARAEEDDKLDGFDAGVDDYVTKPFSLKEILARIQSVLRRTQQEHEHDEKIIASGIILDKASHLVFTDQHEEIHLGPTEFKLLEFLMSKAGRVFSREQLLDNVWGMGVYVDERTVDVHIGRLRKALEKHNLQQLIRTVRGRGYSFVK